MIAAPSVSTEAPPPGKQRPATRPRLGFLGAGWIGLNRLEAIARAGVAEITAIADPSREMLARAGAAAPSALITTTLEELLACDLDGLVIATPSALHAAQAQAALDKGLAVFCQKPLARDGRETAAVIRAARQANRLLGVDLSYRFTEGAQRIRERVQRGELGQIFAIEAAFHNAYGPDKPWFYSRNLSGGGCVIDLGIHLVDLVLWLLDFPQVVHVTSRLFGEGLSWSGADDKVEDYALARLDLDTGATFQMGCSWKLHAGQDAVIQVSLYGTRGGACLRNVNGSFYEFVAESFRGTAREVLSSGPDEWGGRAAVAWARALAQDPEFDPAIEKLVPVAEALDLIYGQKGTPAP
jgi:predicted dehydrogenase